MGMWTFSTYSLRRFRFTGLVAGIFCILGQPICGLLDNDIVELILKVSKQL
jgi:hypothetical protein